MSQIPPFGFGPTVQQVRGGPIYTQQPVAAPPSPGTAGGATLNEYQFLAAGGTLTLTQVVNAVICDTTGAACNINAPRTPASVDRFTIKNAPGDVTNAQLVYGYDPTPTVPGSAIMLEDPNNPGTYGLGPYSFGARGGSQTWRWTTTLAAVEYEGGEPVPIHTSMEDPAGLWVLE